MVDPAVALVVFGITSLVLFALFWPRQGLVARIIKVLRLTDRVLMEDSLKHLYNCQYLSRRGTIESISGALEIRRSRTVKLVAALESRRLVHSDEQGPQLTEEGEAYALRILRSHRLWERYLADRTNVAPVEWHDRAEEREHTLTASQAENLAAKMGDPRYDPHGDPIPTADGELPPPLGIPLTALQPGRSATVVHLEDEPADVYELLVAEGLAPYMQLRLISAAPEAIRFRIDGREHALEPVVAANISVTPLAEAETQTEPVPTLVELKAGQSGIVLDISPACQGPQRRRLLDLGLVPGTEVRAEMSAAFRDPVAYRIRGALIALRRHQAGWIHIERVAERKSA